MNPLHFIEEKFVDHLDLKFVSRNTSVSSTRKVGETFRLRMDGSQSVGDLSLPVKWRVKWIAKTYVFQDGRLTV